MTEFQGLVRDLLDEATSKMISGAGCAAQYQSQLITAATWNRMIDRGNPHLDAIVADADRLGISQLRSRMRAINSQHASDATVLASLVELRNAVAHGDRDKMQRLSQAGVRATLTYVRASQAVLDRHARALDHVVWDHLVALFPDTDPWRS